MARLDLVADIVSAFVANNTVPASTLPALITEINRAIQTAGAPPLESDVARPQPTAAAIRKSIMGERLISFIDGKGYSTLRRHLTARGLTIEEYRDRFGLPKDYPTTAPGYSERRSAIAKAAGLGRKPGETPKVRAKSAS